MANEQNLVPFTSDQSHDEAVKNGAKGGVASGAARREAKAKRERFGAYLSVLAEKGEANRDKAAELLGLKPSEVTQEDMIDARAIIGAKNGNAKDREHIARIMGWYTDRIDITSDDKPLSVNINISVVRTREEAEAILKSREATDD